MAAVIRTIQSVSLPSNPGEFTRDLIDGAVVLSEDPIVPGTILVLIETGVITTKTRAFVLVERTGLVSDESGSRLKPICSISGGQVPLFLFERLVR